IARGAGDGAADEPAPRRGGCLRDAHAHAAGVGRGAAHPAGPRPARSAGIPGRAAHAGPGPERLVSRLGARSRSDPRTGILPSVMGRGWIGVGLVAALLWCTPSFAPSADADDRPLISADRIGPQDDDEPARDSDDHYLSPAERDALAAQGYELQIDDKIVT